jgi:hypothetical protein
MKLFKEVKHAGTLYRTSVHLQQIRLEGNFNCYGEELDLHRIGQFHNRMEVPLLMWLRHSLVLR